MVQRNVALTKGAAFLRIFLNTCAYLETELRKASPELVAANASQERSQRDPNTRERHAEADERARRTGVARRVVPLRDRSRGF
jgi:hypothetical protein